MRSALPPNARQGRARRRRGGRHHRSLDLLPARPEPFLEGVPTVLAGRGGRMLDAYPRQAVRPRQRARTSVAPAARSKAMHPSIEPPVVVTSSRSSTAFPFTSSGCSTLMLSK